MSQASPASGLIETDSYERTRSRFDTAAVASKYPSQYGGRLRERRERQCILKAMESVPVGARVLDLPCGTGRASQVLSDAGYIISGADSSQHMVNLARANWATRHGHDQAEAERFGVADVMNTSFADDQFDAVFCNRLFHHFNESATRVRALKELRRICSQTLVVSFFDSFALDAVRFRLKHAIRGTTPSDRIPIPMKTFEADIRESGLSIVAKIPLLWGISPMCYVVLRRADNRAA